MIECAQGKFPYPYEDDPCKELGFWEIIRYVCEKETPKIPSCYSDDFKDFVNICLRK